MAARHPLSEGRGTARLAAAALGLVLAAPFPLSAGVGTIEHRALRGGFDLTGTTFEDVAGLCTGAGPRMELWGPVLSSFEDVELCAPWMLNARHDLGLVESHPGRWLSIHTDWSPFDTYGDARATLGMSYVDEELEGTEQHRAFYLIATVSSGACFGTTDLDRVSDGFGAEGNVVPIQVVPPPRVLGGSVHPSARFFCSTALLPPLLEFGDPGHDSVIRGYRLFYRSGCSSSSSAAWAWATEASDPLSPGAPLGVLPKTGGSFEFCVPFSGLSDVWAVVSAIEYEDGVPLPRVTSNKRCFVGTGMVYPQPHIEHTASFDPAEVGPGEPVTLHISAALMSAAEPGIEIWSHLRQELAPGCIDLASGRDLDCPLCASASYDPISGSLRATSDGLALDLTITFDAGAVSEVSCTTTVWGTGPRERFVPTMARFLNLGSLRAVLRDDSVRATSPRPDLSAIFPLSTFLEPSPGLPWTDAPGVLGDRTRPWVFYGHAGERAIYLTKDLAVASVQMHSADE